MPDPKILYVRELPGGGLVMIEGIPQDDTSFRGRITVERRHALERRDGHHPPVIAETEAPSPALVFRALYDIASDNVAVARGLIRWQARARAD